MILTFLEFVLQEDIAVRRRDGDGNIYYVKTFNPRTQERVKPRIAKPSTAKPSTAKPSTAKPSIAKPSIAKPSIAKPSTAVRTVPKQKTSKPTTRSTVSTAKDSKNTSAVKPTNSEFAKPKILDVMRVKNSASGAGADYTEFATLHANPKPNDLTNDESYDRHLKQYYVGAWLSPTTQSWYTFPRNHAGHADTIQSVRKHVPNASKESLIPVYLYVSPLGQVQTITNAPWSGDHSMDQIKNAVKSIPSMNKIVGTTARYETDKDTAELTAVKDLYPDALVPRWGPPRRRDTPYWR